MPQDTQCFHPQWDFVAEWLELVTTNPRAAENGRQQVGSWVSFHPGFIPRFLTCWSTDPNSNLSPVEKPPSLRIQRIFAAV